MRPPVRTPSGELRLTTGRRAENGHASTAEYGGLGV